MARKASRESLVRKSAKLRVEIARLEAEIASFANPVKKVAVKS